VTGEARHTQERRSLTGRSFALHCGMPILRDYDAVRPLLLKDEQGTRSICNVIYGVAGARASWVRVDDLEHPHAVIARWRALYLHATDTSAARRLMASLPKRWRLDFAATQMRFIPAMRRVRKVGWVSPCYMYVLEPKKLVIDRKHRVGELRPEDVGIVAHFWPYGRSRTYVGWRITDGPTCAVRKDGKLVAWALTHGDGTMGMLHVLEECRGLGMARSITTAIAQRCLKAGLKPFLYIVQKNKASINLTESMGFTRHPRMYAWYGE
jgi:GNAT superfamily N-acetyltransferase